jgi:hypothetical protein
MDSLAWPRLGVLSPLHTIIPTIKARPRAIIRGKSHPLEDSFLSAFEVMA